MCFCLYCVPVHHQELSEPKIVFSKEITKHIKLHQCCCLRTSSAVGFPWFDSARARIHKNLRGFIVSSLMKNHLCAHKITNFSSPTLHQAAQAKQKQHFFFNKKIKPATSSCFRKSCVPSHYYLLMDVLTIDN